MVCNICSNLEQPFVTKALEPQDICNTLGHTRNRLNSTIKISNNQPWIYGLMQTLDKIIFIYFNNYNKISS